MSILNINYNPLGREKKDDYIFTLKFPTYDD